jgi:hypothetical protein
MIDLSKVNISGQISGPNLARATALWLTSLLDAQADEALQDFLVKIRDKAIVDRRMGFYEAIRYANHFGREVLAELEKAAAARE